MNSPLQPAELKELYDEKYANKLLALEESRRIRTILSFVRLPDNSTILDIGCGNGLLAFALSESVSEYHGVDFSEAFIKSARKRVENAGMNNCKFYCADICNYSEKNQGRYDAVFALDISEHVPDEEWGAIVESIERVLKPGGQVILHTPNLDFFVERMKDRNLVLKQFPEHVAVRTRSQNMAFFERAGFSGIAVRYLPHYNGLLRLLHPLCTVPVVGSLFAARLLVTAFRQS